MKPSINYDQFVALDIRIAEVISAEVVENADLLLKITLDLGEEGERTVISGIKNWYTPEELVGKQVVYLMNLEPRKIRGVISQGMILAAGDDDSVGLLCADKIMKKGVAIK